MTRDVCEKMITGLLKQIYGVYHEYDPDGEGLNLFIGQHGKFICGFNEYWGEDFKHPINFYNDGREHSDGCWNCREYNPEKMACMLRWNNADPDCYYPELDDRKPDQTCNEHQYDPDAVWEDFFGEEDSGDGEDGEG